MNKLIFSLPQNNPLALALADKLKIETGLFEIRDFPDGETYLRIDTDVKNKTIILICSLDHPNSKIIPLMFMAQKLKELGAKKILLVSPYLPYMRQDKQFKPGEAVTSVLFAKFISSFIDSVITIDPHLHRIKNLSDIYAIPTITLHATKPISDWIQKNITSPLIIGPDEESLQWVSDIAKNSNASYVIAKKVRHEDRKVSIEIPDITDDNKTPVIVDDIISTGISMSVLIKQLLSKNIKNPICISIHALFNQEAYKDLLDVGAQQVVSCNTIPHFSNKIDITDIIFEEIKALIV